IGAPAGLFRVAGTDGSIWTENDKVYLATRESTHELELPADLALPQPDAGADPRQQTAEWQRLTAVELAPYSQLCMHLRSLIEGSPSPGPVMPATFADGVASVRVIEAIRASARQEGALIRV